MKSKAKDIIRYLINSQPSTASTLADALNVSIRTIKTYIKEINQEYPETIVSSHEGYRIDQSKAAHILTDKDNPTPQTSQERVVYIISKLINHNNKTALDIYDLCDELFISLSTLKNELNKVKRKLNRFDLELNMNSDTIECIGLEKNKRKMLSSILYNESNNHFVNINSLQNAFIDIDIHFIKETVLEIFSQYHYFINDYSLINLVSHIAIAVDRIRNNNFNTQNIDSFPEIKLHEFDLSRELAKKLEDHFNIKYSDAEIYEMTLLIISRATEIDYKSINKENIEQFIGLNCLNLVNSLIQDVNSFYYIDLSEPEFFIRFALHIRNLLVRSKNNYFSKNPLTDSIKVSCPLIYDVSVNMARTIKELTGITINDDEIAYIAFHLGSTLEAQRSLTYKIRALLYCPNYYDINLRITDMINHHFENELLITNILTDESEIDKIKDTDLIIATTPLSKASSFPSININIFLSPRDQTELANKINLLQKEKSKKKFEKYLRELIQPCFFERNNTLQNEEECIDYMVKKLEKEGYVDASFKEEVLEREKMSSTAFRNFAIPHSMKMFAKKTGMNIIISSTPINWKNTLVHLVIMMCFSKNERYIFNEIYDPVTMILSEPENVRKILQSHTYEEFIASMVSLL